MQVLGNHRMFLLALRKPELQSSSGAAVLGMLVAGSRHSLGGLSRVLQSPPALSSRCLWELDFPSHISYRCSVAVISALVDDKCTDWCCGEGSFQSCSLPCRQPGRRSHGLLCGAASDVLHSCLSWVIQSFPKSDSLECALKSLRAA